MIGVHIHDHIVFSGHNLQGKRKIEGKVNFVQAAAIFVYLAMSHMGNVHDVDYCNSLRKEGTEEKQWFLIT